MEDKTLLRLLLIEERPGSGDFVKEVLTADDRRFEIVQALGPHHAADIMRRENLDGVVIDIDPNQAESIEIIRELRSIGSNIPLLVFHGQDNHPDLGSNHNHNGATHFFGKNQPRHRLLLKTILCSLENHRERELQNNLEKLVALNPDAIIVVNIEGVVQFVNEAATRLFSRDKEDFVGDLLGFSVKEGALAEIEVLSNGETRNAEMHVVRLQWNNRPALLASIRDTTDQKRMSERLRQAQRLAAVGQLAGGIAHDFNNILAAIIGNLKLIELELPSNDSTQISLGEIEKAVTRAQEIIQQILTFSRNQEVERKSIEIEPVIDEAIRFLRATIPTKIEIKRHVERNLPPIAADATQIHQIMMNLGINAVHAMSGNGVLEISLTQAQMKDDNVSRSFGLKPGSYVVISVSDSGAGMDRETCSRIFEPFYTTKPQGVGTGLGLSVVHGIMKSHEGAVTVYSEPGNGTVFNLYFPAREDLAPEDLAGEPRKIESQGSGHVLYVDDEEALVFLATRILERDGFVVSGYTDPEEALSRFIAEPDAFDMLITDMSMPRLSGPELAERVISIRPELPVVMFTGYISAEDSDIGVRLGVKEIVQKPNSIDKLTEIVNRFIR